MGTFVEGVWYFIHDALFPSPLFSIFLFFHNFMERLKVIILSWWPDNDNVTHKHLVEMIRLICDETPFLSAMQLRSITLVWWPDDGNFISLDIHGCDKSAHDETSYPSTNLLRILSYILGPLYSKISVLLLSWMIPGQIISKVYIRILYFTQHQPLWDFIPFFPSNEGEPLIGSIYPKIQREKEVEGNNDGRW